MTKMKQLVLTVDFPEDQEEKLMSELATILGYRGEGTKAEFVTQKAQAAMTAWFAGVYRVGFNNKPVRPADVGLGDTIARIIRYMTTPFRWLSMNCGCDARRKWLNEKVNYQKIRLWLNGVRQ